MGLRSLSTGATWSGTSARHQTVVQQHVTPAICELEQRVIADIAAERGVDLTLAVRDEILAFGRDDVRARLLIESTRLAGLAPGERDAVEQGAVEWLTARYRQFRGDMARASSEEYATWADDPCAYTPPGDFTYDPPAADCGGLVSLFSGGPRPVWPPSRLLAVAPSYRRTSLTAVRPRCRRTPIRIQSRELCPGCRAPEECVLRPNLRSVIHCPQDWQRPR